MIELPIFSVLSAGDLIIMTLLPSCAQRVGEGEIEAFNRRILEVDKPENKTFPQKPYVFKKSCTKLKKMSMCM